MAPDQGSFAGASLATDQPPIADEQLVAMAREDPAALVSLYRRHYDGVFRLCVHRLFDRAAAEDVTSTVFLKVVEKLSRFGGRGGSFRSWLYGIATNAIRDHLRRSRRRAAREAAVSLAPSACTDGPAAGQDEEAARLKQAILKLRDRQQAIIAMRYFDQMRLTEIAAVLGSSPASVRKELSRAMARLRKKLR